MLETGIGGKREGKMGRKGGKKIGCETLEIS